MGLGLPFSLKASGEVALRGLSFQLELGKQTVQVCQIFGELVFRSLLLFKVRAQVLFFGSKKRSIGRSRWGD